MAAIGILVLAVALVGVGALATIVSARVFPLWILVLGQEHGRYAGLCASEPAHVGGTRRKAGEPPAKSPGNNPGLALSSLNAYNGIPIPEIGI